MTLECKLAEYSALYSGKIMWGLDCDIEQLELELYKIYSYIFLLNTLNTANDCEYHIPVDLIQKIKQYQKAINKRNSTFCSNCN